MTKVWLYVFLQALLRLKWYSIYSIRPHFKVSLERTPVGVVDPTSRPAVSIDICVMNVDKQIRTKSVICVVESIIGQILFKIIFRIVWQNTEREMDVEC